MFDTHLKHTEKSHEIFFQNPQKNPNLTHFKHLILPLMIIIDNIKLYNTVQSNCWHTSKDYPRPAEYPVSARS